MVEAVNIMNNNQVKISGIVRSDFIFSHEIFGENFYIIYVSVLRDSDMADLLPIMVSDRVMHVGKSMAGQEIFVEGQFRSYNLMDRKLMLVVFARRVYTEVLTENEMNTNMIFLNGFICKPPVYRKTPLGREITDLLVAVNRTYGKTDYIPCICWGKNARYTRGFEVGMQIRLLGRVQSRMYRKRKENEYEVRTAYEISVARLQCIGV